MNMHVNIIEAFLEALVKELDVPDHRYEQAETSYSSLGEWLHRPASTVRQYDPQVYCQGSFRLGTAIRPHTEAEEYDVDSVVELRLLTKSDKTQQELKAMLGAEIKAYHDAMAMVKPVREGNRCWILDYADGAQFHMDVVPAVPNHEQQLRLLNARMLNTKWGDVTLLGNDGKKRVGGNSDQFGCHSIPLRRCADTVNVSGES
ncbi:nucleotidyltransferase [Shinella sp. SUS2]|uniref:nucleotidyltransferase domain-containing protein n=1 Tax=Shinella sp. SUS2 TaxID=1692241 RepID=UPI00068001F2|nr:nucleotidyltransferase [Shinella sp. SUS2]